MGKIQTSKACNSHKPDVFSLVGDDRKMSRMQHLAAALHGMTPSELQTAAALIMAEKHTRKFGWRFMQKVYIRYTGSASNYMSNFMVGHVLYADKENVRVIGESGKVFVTAINEKEGMTVYTVARFKKLREQMIAEKKLVDPKIAQYAAASKRGAIAQLDDVLEQVEKLNPKLKKGKRRDDDLVALVTKMTQGRVSDKPKKRRSSLEGAEITMAW